MRRVGQKNQKSLESRLTKRMTGGRQIWQRHNTNNNNSANRPFAPVSAGLNAASLSRHFASVVFLSLVKSEQSPDAPLTAPSSRLKNFLKFYNRNLATIIHNYKGNPFLLPHSLAFSLNVG